MIKKDANVNVFSFFFFFPPKAGQRPFFPPQMQQVRPRWQPMQPQQQVRQPGMQGMPGAGQVPRARGIRQVPPRGVPGQQQTAGAGGPNQRVGGGMGQAQQVRGPGMQGQGQRPTYKFQQNVRNQPAQGHPAGVAMQPHDQVQQPIAIPVSILFKCFFLIKSSTWGNNLLEENTDVSLLIFQSLKGKIVFFLFVEERY